MAASQSQISSQALDPGWTTIPLEKFSFAISPDGARTHQWVHDTRQDELFLVFRTVRLSHGEGGYESRLMMSVSAGGEVLERQDVGKLVEITEQFDSGKRSGRVDPAFEDPVHVVVKTPCIAIRYPASPTTVRRIQMRFKSDLEYQRAIDIFAKLKLPIRNAPNKVPAATAARPLRPASTSLLQQPLPSFVDCPSSHLCSVETYHSPAFGGLSSASALSRPFSAGESPYFKRPQTASSETVRPDSVRSLDERPSDTISSTSFVKPPPRPRSPIGTPIPTSSIYSSQHEKETHLPRTTYSNRTVDPSSLSITSQVLERNITVAGSSATSDFFGPPITYFQASPILANAFPLRDDAERFRRATSAYRDSNFQRHDHDMRSDRRMSPHPGFFRPLSAPVAEIQYNPNELAPPRRELPFPKARGTAKPQTPTAAAPNVASISVDDEPQTNEIIQSATPKTSAPALNRDTKMVALRKEPELAQVARVTALGSPPEEDMNNGGRRGSRQVVLEHEEEPSPLAAKSTTVVRPSTVRSLRSKSTTTSNRKRPCEVEADLASVNKHAKKMLDKATQTQTLSGRDHTVPMSLTSVNERSLSTIANEAHTQSPPQSCVNAINAFVSKHKHRPSPQELWQKPGYADASPEERYAIINDFICENLDNEDFLKLCEDTGDVWRRIGLEI